MSDTARDLLEDTPPEAFAAALRDAYALLVMGQSVEDRAKANGGDTDDIMIGAGLLIGALRRLIAEHDDDDGDNLLTGDVPLHELRAMLDAHTAPPTPSAARPTHHGRRRSARQG